MGEHAQAINSSRLRAQNDRPECHWLAPVAFCERDFRRSKISLGPDKYRHALGRLAIFRQHRFDGARIGLERGYEMQVALLQLLGKCLGSHWCGNFRQVVLTALLAGLQRDGAPLFLLLGGISGIDLNDGAVREERHDAGGPEFHRLLHDEIHVFPLWHSLGQRDGAGWGRGCRAG